MDLFQVIIFLLLIVLPGMTFFLLLRNFTSEIALETKVKKEFEQQNYGNIIELVRNRKLNRLTSTTSLAVARSYASSKALDDALRYYKAMLSRENVPTYLRFEALCETSELFCKRNEFNKAEKNVLEALMLFPENAKANHRLAYILYVTNRAREALTILQSLLKKVTAETKSIITDVKGLLAEVMAFLELYEQALPHYQAVEALGRKQLSYLYAKTLRENQLFDQAIIVYKNLIKTKNTTEKISKLMIECAEIYLEKGEYTEGIIFTEESIAALDEKERAHLRYLRALMLSANGDDFVALHEFATLKDALPANKDIKEILDIGGNILQYPILKRYFTADRIIFEKCVEDMLPKGASITKRSKDYYICSHGAKAYVFYRRYTPINETVMENLDRTYPNACFRASILEIYAYGGAPKNIKLLRKEYTAMLISGDRFAKRIAVPLDSYIPERVK